MVPCLLPGSGGENADDLLDFGVSKERGGGWERKAKGEEEVVYREYERKGRGGEEGG